MRRSPSLRIEIGPSRSAQVYSAILALSTATLITTLPVPAWAIAVAWGILARWASARWRAYGVRRNGCTPVEVLLTGQRRVEIRDAQGRTCAGAVRDLSYVSATVTTIVWKPDGARGSRSILVLPDMLAPEDFRRLRVLLRYGRSDDVAGAPASQA